MRLKTSLRVLAGTGLVLLALVSCRTPSPPLAYVHPSQALPEGRDFYFFLSVPKNRDFLKRFFREYGLASRGTDYLLENSSLLYGAAAAVSGGIPRLVLAAEGDFSKSLVEFGLGREESWEEIERKVGGGRIRAFREKKSGFELAVPENRIMVLAAGNTEESLRRLEASSPSALASGLVAEFEAHAAAAYLPSPGETVVGLVSPDTPPLTGLTLFLDRSDSAYGLSGKLSFRTERDGRIIAAIVKLFLAEKMAEQGFSGGDLRKLLKVELESEALLFSGFSLPEADLATLLGAMLQKGMKGGKP